ncbi:MAG: SDR family NAD(P)-dependent oxidoreductase [Bacteriovoracia bacterium]
MKTAILITGAGTGIGRAMALTLSQKLPETTLILAGRNLTNLEKTQSALKTNALCVSMDVTDNKSIQAAKKQITQSGLTLSALVMNAGVGGENNYGKDDRWDDILATNLTGPYQVTQEFLPLLRANKSAFKNIVFTSSILARLGVPRYSAYCASKAGVLGLMRSLAAELASEKILVNAICPGWVDTDMAQQGLKGISEAMGKSMADTTREQMSMVPLQKMSRPEEIAELVYFLVGGVQTSITGQSLDINNGALMP